ncbi:aspartate--tRNA(Asn) ligase [soil metagenome]
MERTLSKAVAGQIGKPVMIEGWLHKKRLLGGLSFILVRDRQGVTQVVVEDKDEVEKLRALQVGTVLRVRGNVVKEDRAPGGAEIHDAKLEVMVAVTDESPIEIDKPLDHKSENLNTLFDNRVVGLRNLRETAIFKIQDRVLEGARRYFYQNGFTEMKTPKLLAKPTEGGAEVFTLDYFGQTASLAQSAQFYKQIMVGVFERVFEMGGTYRAEPSSTTRHMSEYVTIDCEMGFVTFDELREFAHGLLKSVVDFVWSECPAELKMWNIEKPLLSDKAVSIPMAKIHELYEAATKDIIHDKKDLTPAEEKWVCEYAKKEFGTEAVFVIEWPSSSMKFYHKKTEGNEELCDRSDFLFRGVEIMTAPMRENRYQVLLAQMKEQGLDEKEEGYQAYLSAFKYGLPPHGGFGLGLERLTQRIIGLNSVKDATLFPRDITRLAP